MSLPISTIANISISSTPKLASRTGFGTLMGVTMEQGDIDTAERIRFYADATSVATDFPDGPEIQKLATTYFSQVPAPTSFAVGMRYESIQYPTLYCSSLPSTFSVASDLSDSSFTFKFTVTTGGTPTSFEYAITFGTITTGAEAAAELQAVFDDDYANNGGLNLSVVYEDSTTQASTGNSKDRFIFSWDDGATVGDTISWLEDATSGTNIATVIGGTQSDGYKSDNIQPEDIYDSLNALYEKNSSWYGCAFTKEMVDDYVTGFETHQASGVLDAAFWCQGISATSPKVFFNQTFDTNTINVNADSGLATHICYQLKQAGYKRTLSSFCSDGVAYGAVSAAGYAFTWNPNAVNSHYTLKFKEMPTIPTEELSTTQKINIDSTYCNAVIDVGGDPIYAEGYVQNGQYFDTIHGLDWLENALETNVFNYLKSAASKRPANNVGQAGIEQSLRDGLEEAKTNGFIGPGYGTDGTYYPLGYEVFVPELSTSDKQARQSTGITFIAIGTGALHGVQVEGVYEE